MYLVTLAIGIPILKVRVKLPSLLLPVSLYNIFFYHYIAESPPGGNLRSVWF